jgi:hypothetical protein
MPTTKSPLLATAESFFSALSICDMDRVASFLAPEYEHHFLPASSGLGPPVDRDALIGRFTGLRSIATGVEITINQAWPNDAAHTITLQTTNTPHFKDIVKRPEDVEGEWDFSIQCMFVLTMDESGEKMVKSIEFVEGPTTEKMMVQVPKAFQRVGIALGP